MLSLSALDSLWEEAVSSLLDSLADSALDSLLDSDALDAELPEQVEGLVLAKQYKYGKILVSRYEKEEQL